MTPVSNGWITLVPPFATILPGAVATMSIRPTEAQTIIATASTTMVQATARPIGDGGVSTISSAAGRNSVSARLRLLRDGTPSRKLTKPSPPETRAAQPRPSHRTGASRACPIVLSHFMETRLHHVEGGVTALAADQL